MKNNLDLLIALNENTLQEAVWSTKCYGSYYHAICVLNTTEEGEEATYYLWKDKVSTTGSFTNVWQKKDLPASKVWHEINKLRYDVWQNTHFLLKEKVPQLNSL